MMLKSAVTEKITQELLSKIITLLSSTSSVLSLKDINDIVSTEIESFKNLQYADHNDLGLCVSRLTEMCQVENISDKTAFESLYPSIRSNDTFVTELVDIMAHGIASKFSTPLYDIRHIIPKEAKEISENIIKKVPSEEESIRPVLRHFDWGKLGTDIGRTNAFMFAKDRVGCFKRDTVHIYDTDKILMNLPSGNIKTIIDSNNLKQNLINKLTNSINENGIDNSALKFIKPAVDAIFSSAAHRQTVTSARLQLANKKIAHSVIEVTDTIDNIENILRMINMNMLTSLDDSSVISNEVVNNIEIVLSDIQLLRAAMIYYKENTLSDKIILTNTTVNKPVLLRFESSGGNESLVSDYISYTRINEHITIPNVGVTSDTVYNMREKTSHAVKTHESRLKEIAASERANALQENLLFNLNMFNEIMIKQDKYNIRRRQDEHEDNRHKALLSLRNKPLEDVAVEYLIAMRDNNIIKSLYKSINDRFHSLVQQEKNITTINIAKSTCSAIAATLLEQLSSRFCVKETV